MELKVSADKLSAEMEAEIEAGKRAVTKVISRTASKVQTAWRGEVRSSGLGSRLAQAIRMKVYPENQASLEAAGLIYARPGKSPETGAARIIAGHEEGSVIRAVGRSWLAIPTEEAGRARRSKVQVTPAEWQRRTGIKLNVVVRPNGNRLLVANVRLGKPGKGGAPPRLVRGRMTKSGAYGSGTFASVIFVLVPQVKLRKRLRLMDAADRSALELPQAIVREWQRKG